MKDNLMLFVFGTLLMLGTYSLFNSEKVDKELKKIHQFTAREVIGQK